jgi:hypothetical protein
MQIFEKKPERGTTWKPAPRREAVTCGACGHVRMESDVAADWQCPACKVAYRKVTDEYREEYNERLQRVTRHKAEGATRWDQTPEFKLGSAGAFGGYLTYVKGMANACAGVAASPALKILGAGIVVVSIAYMAWKLLS